MTEHITVSRELLRQVLDGVKRSRCTAMIQTLAARIPESGLFGGIAQDLDFAESKLRTILEQPVVEPVVEPLPAFEVGSSGFDHKTAADFLNGKTVGDEAVRKFVATSRWAHDDRASLQSLVATLRQDMAAREAEISMLKQALLDDEAKEQPAVGPTDAQIALLDPWMRPAAAKELLTKVLALSVAAPQAQPAVEQEPVAWIYQNANTDNEYLVWKKGTGGRNWKPLFTSPSAQKTVVEVDYRGMYLKVRDELAAAQQRLDTCEALARSVMNDQVGRA